MKTILTALLLLVIFATGPVGWVMAGTIYALKKRARERQETDDFAEDERREAVWRKLREGK